jgi:hypothetical protein
MRFSQVCSNWKTAQTKKPNPNTTKTWDGKHRNFTHPQKEKMTCAINGKQLE